MKSSQKLIESPTNHFLPTDDEHVSKESSHVVAPSFHNSLHLASKVTVFSVTLTLIGTIVGGGVVGIPYATLKTGIYLALGVHLFNFACGIYSVQLLLNARNITGLGSFSEIGYFCFGRASIFIINGLVAIAMCGMPIVYFMIVGDVGSGLLSRIDKIEGTFWADRKFPILIFAVLFFIWVLKKEIQELKGTGFILVAGVLIFVVILTVKLIVDGTGHLNISDFQKPKWDIELLANIPTIFLSYAFQSSFYPAFQSLKDKTDRNGIMATIWSFVFVAGIYIGISFVSLLKYGTDLSGDVLHNVTEEDGVVPIILNFLFLIVASITIPIVLFVGKEAVLIIIDETLRKSYSQSPRPILDNSYGLVSSVVQKVNSNSEGKQYLQLHPAIYYIVTITIYCGVVIGACFLKDVTVIFGIIGSTAGAFLIFIAPAAFWIRSVSIEKVEVGIAKLLIAWVYLLFGFVVFGACIFATLYTAAN